MVETTSSNPLPSDAEHTAAPAKATESDANPLNPPATARAADASDEGQQKMIGALSYLFWPVALIGLLGNKPFQRFHGANSLALGLSIVIVYVAGFILSFILAIIFPLLGVLAGLAMLLLILGLAGVSLYSLYKAAKGSLYVEPVLGKIVLEKLNLKTDDVRP